MDREIPINGKELYKQLSRTPLQMALRPYTEELCNEFAEKIVRIEELKRSKNAVVLAHHYVPREIIFGVADYVGDSYKLSQSAAETDAEIIVFSAVRFMAETAKILNPEKRVFIPATNPACSLADSIDANKVKALRKQYPDHAFICYINTDAAVKALCDVCVTSSNAIDICERYPNDKIVFVPDRLMGANIKNALAERGVRKEIVIYEEGACHVHERFDPDLISLFKEADPNIKVLSHPECYPAVIEQSDYVGSTAQIISTVKKFNDPETLLILTECGLISGLVAEHPEHRFIGSCQMCQYMKSNSLEGILRVLEDPKPEDEVLLDADIIKDARRCIDAMFEYAEK